MKARLVRVDLSDEARDFRAIAIEPGVPLLDSAGNNAEVLRVWLGRFVAQPEWEGRYVCFGPPADVSVATACRPVTPVRLHGPLREELAELRSRVDAVRPQTHLDRLLHQTIQGVLHGLTNDPKRPDVGCHFLEYRDDKGRWRLLWCPGYERVGKDEASGRICGRSRCRLLYAHRRGCSGKCPACDPKGAAERIRPLPWKWYAAAALLLAALLFTWWWPSGERPEPPGDGPQLVVEPAEVVLWLEESLPLRRVTLDAGEGGAQETVDYRLEIVSGGEFVAVEEGNTLQALAEGAAELRVTAIDPDGPGDGVETVVPVTVTELAKVSLEPAEVTLDMGDTSPKFVVLAQGRQGAPRQVEAELESLDDTILAPHPVVAGAFFAKELGGTSVRAFYLGREGFAEVNVRGERFREVEARLNERSDDFDVTLRVLAAASQGPLQYRVYPADETPEDNWVEAELTEDGEHREVTLSTPPITYGPRNARYRLVIEARDPSGASVQQYPFSFRLVVSDIEAASPL